MTEEFYIGYLPEAPRGLARRLRTAVLILACAGVLGAGALAALHRRLPASRFEFGVERQFQGTLLSDPYPVLRVRRPGEGIEPGEGWSRYLLVAPGKFGAQALARGFDGQTVSLRGTLVFRDGRTMIEVLPESVERIVTEADPRPDVALGPRWLGRQTFVGEIVDSKCQMGVMNPGERKTHRACATLCIGGGIPPLLLVRAPSGAGRSLLLVSADGHAVNRDVLELVAVPVRITGEVWRTDDLYVLRADPATYERLSD